VIVWLAFFVLRRVCEKRLKKKKLDGIQNIITGLNPKQKDKRVNIVAIPDLLTKQEAEGLYATDRTARKIVEKVPKEGVKKWIELLLRSKNSSHLI
jgi:hypothetical protein